MQQTMFYKSGVLFYQLRWPIIIIWMLAILACLPFLPNLLEPFKTTGFIDEKSESAKAEQFLNEKLGYNNDNKFIIMYHSKQLLATNSLFISKIKKSLVDLEDFPIKHEIFMPNNNKKQISKDKHTAYVFVQIKSKTNLNDDTLEQFKKAIKTPRNMTVDVGGEAVFMNDLNKQSEQDIYKADFIAIPVAIITLLMVFGSVVAALIPVVLGGFAAVFMLTTLYFIGQVCTLSIFTINIALLLGLCLSLDYALFVTSRFRDELEHSHDVAKAIAVSQAHAGQAVFFSGVAVFASLSGLLIFPINILFSVAIGGLTAVFFAVLTAIVLLPAVLSVLGTGINCLSVRRFTHSETTRTSFWKWIAQRVVKRPVFFFISIFIILLLLGYPSVSAKFGVSDFRILPEHSPYRKVFNTYTKEFKENELTPISLTVIAKSGSILSRKNISRLVDLTKKLKNNPMVDQVNSIVNTDTKLSKEQYYRLYSMSKKSMSQSVKSVLETTTRHSFTVVTVVSKYHINSPKTKDLITSLRAIKSPYFTITLSGKPVSNDDLLMSVAHLAPYALLWILVFTYLILLTLLRSLFLPFKAIMMNILSLCACYGALHLVFQEGYFHQLLNFEPQGMLDVSLLVIIFCALFGFSMDYEVFLLTRIKEAYDQSHDNEKSIIFGIEKSSKIITSAAVIVIFTCMSFLFADVLVVKAFGLGISVAIFIDAFLIRSILVPSTMVLVKKWNWYLPKWLDKILPKC